MPVRSFQVRLRKTSRLLQPYLPAERRECLMRWCFGQVVPRTRLEAQDLHARSSSLGPASLPSQPAAAQPGGDPAFERALGSFGFGEVPSAKFTRRKKGASVADAARADKRGGPSAGLKARAGKAGASAHAVYAKLQAHRQATAIGDGDSEDAEY